MSKSKQFIASFLVLCVVGGAMAQDGVSTGGAARTKYLSGLGIIPSPKEVVVEDFINYHRHEIGRPKAGESVHLDMRWAKSPVSSSEDSVLQIGISTSLTNDRAQLRPINLTLVIDKSGSMSSLNKLERVKASLFKLIKSLRPMDTLAIVAFDSEPTVVFPSQKFSSESKVYPVIAALQPGSSTNINGGLMLGYQEAKKGFIKGGTNRVILLTDGIANVGVVEPAEIVKNSLPFNDFGIDLSTIGVGQDLQKDMLMDLAKSGRGLYHFVADNEDTDKVFVNEVQSLLSPVGREVKLQIDLGSGNSLKRVYGFAPKISGNSVSVPLDNMNTGMTEVVLVRLKAGTKLSDIKAKLTFFDVEKNKTVTLADSIRPEVSRSGSEDLSVIKNLTIAELATAIREMAAAVESKNVVLGEKLISRAVSDARERFPNATDVDILRVLTAAESYQKVVREELGRTVNLIDNGDFTQGNKGFTSPFLNYVPPSENCLWANGYTLAPTFNHPHLHRLIDRQEFRAPNGGNVFFSNAGGTDNMEIIMKSVKCSPNQTYEISCQVISLTPGVEWIPSFEIRANGARSEPQLAKDRQYTRVSFVWNSGESRTANLTIMRMPIPHGGGIIGVANLQMIPVSGL